MKKLQIITFFVSATVLFSCSTDTKTTEVNTVPVDSTKQEATSCDPHWKDSIVLGYLKTNNPLEKVMINSAKSPAYSFESEKRDGKDFIAVRIGESLADHFVTYSWLYIDSVTKDVYELDMATDSLKRIFIAK